MRISIRGEDFLIQTTMLNNTKLDQQDVLQLPQTRQRKLINAMRIPLYTPHEIQDKVTYITKMLEDDFHNRLKRGSIMMVTRLCQTLDADLEAQETYLRHLLEQYRILVPDNYEQLFPAKERSQEVKMLEGTLLERIKMLRLIPATSQQSDEFPGMEFSRDSWKNLRGIVGESKQYFSEKYAYVTSSVVAE